VSHEFKVLRTKSVSLEFNALNVFNQKQVRHIFDIVNRIGGNGRVLQSSALQLPNENLQNGYDYNALLARTADAARPAGTPGAGYQDPRYGMADIFNPGFEVTKNHEETRRRLPQHELFILNSESEFHRHFEDSSPITLAPGTRAPTRTPPAGGPGRHLKPRDEVDDGAFIGASTGVAAGSGGVIAQDDDWVVRDVHVENVAGLSAFRGPNIDDGRFRVSTTAARSTRAAVVCESWRVEWPSNRPM
jgi:hypothetical protein